MNKFKIGAIFITGMALGATGSWFITKQKYEQILEEEIESVKETYKNRQVLVVNEIKEEKKEEVEEDAPTLVEKEEYKSIIENNGYTNYTKYMDTDEKEETVVNDRCDMPYVIDPEEYGEDGYDVQTLTYYADGVLIDDLDDIVEDPDTVVGLENLKVFEEFGATSVMVRNEIWKVDFEITKDDWNYSDLNQDVPPKEEMKEFFSNAVKERRPHEV
jgi:hypothetical protein